MEFTRHGHATPETSDPESAVAATDAAPLRRVRTVARVLDEAFRVPGTDVRVGLDPILGIIPGVGDGVAALFSLYVVLEAAVAGVPRTTLLQMLAVVAVDAVVGSVPVVGPLFDAVWKANTWNVRAFERHVAMSGSA